MTDLIDWEQMVVDTFGEDAMAKTPWIKLEDGVPFVGVLTMVKPGQLKFDKPVVEIYFDDEGMERTLDASVAMMKRFLAVAPQVGDTVQITRSKKMSVDKDGNPVMGQNPETGAEEQKSFTNYKVEIVGTTEKTTDEPEEKEVKKPAAKKEPAVGEEIDISGIPF